MTTGRRNAAIGVVLVALLATAIVLVPAKEWAIAFVMWMRGQGALAIVIFAGAYIIVTVSLVPASVLTLGAGFVYGVVGGSLLVVPVAIVAAMVAFVVARRFGRQWIIARVRAMPRFAALDRAVERAGFKITLLLRLSPIFPFGLLNYALGITGIRARDYVMATAIGVVPGTVAYVYIGSLVTSAAELGSGGSQSFLYWVGGGLTIVATIAITVVARRELRREFSEATP